MTIKVPVFACLMTGLAFMLQGCPKSKALQSCYLNNIIVYGGIRATPAADSLPLGDTLFLSSAIFRNVFDNNNQPVNLDGKGLNTRFEIRRVNPFAAVAPSDVTIIALAGSMGEIKISGTALSATINYATVADSMKLRAAMVFAKKGVYQLGGESGLGSYSVPAFSSFFHQTGNCYQGRLTDTISNPNRHWYLYGLPTYNVASAYFVKIY
jgi:hypothetical protein